MKKAFFGSPLIAVVGQRLLLHLLQDLVGAALLQQTVVAECLLEADPGEEEDEHEHPGDRDVVGLQEDVEELTERGHARGVQGRVLCVNRTERACVARALRAKRPGISAPVATSSALDAHREVFSLARVETCAHALVRW